MKILLFDMGSYTFRDTKDAILSFGHEVDEIYYHFEDRFKDDFFSERIDICLKRKKYDAIISINFFPLLAIAARDHETPYISWSYDSPLAEKLSEYFSYDTNSIFLFDRNEVSYYNARGFSNVYHLPLAVNPDRINKLSFSTETNKRFHSEISFVGSIHNSYLNELLFNADEYTRGYIEGLFQTQFRLYGCNIVEDSISNEILDSLNASYSKIGNNSLALTKRGLSYAINAQITHIERKLILELLAEKHDVRFYTSQNESIDKRVKQMGPVKYFTDMNAVFRNSLLNLCPTFKSITSGIPLRALDILANKAVLFSNFQPELADYFVDGQDIIMYESLEEAVSKANYYLSRKDILSQIATSGYQKTIKHFSYSDRVSHLLYLIK